jgi:hypothetical protein
MTLLMSPWLVEGSGGLRDILGRSYDKNYQVIHPASWVGPFYSVMRWIVNERPQSGVGLLYYYPGEGGNRWAATRPVK